MITVIRKYQKPLMFVVAVLTIIAFAWLYNPAETSELGANVAARVYGRILTPADVDRIARTYDLAVGLGLLDLVMGLGGSGPEGGPSMSDYVLNIVVLRHEAGQLGIVPAPAQVAGRIREMQLFQSGGRFDPTKFEAFVNERLGPRGMTTLSLEEVVSDAIRYERVSGLVGSAAAAGVGEMSVFARSRTPVDLLVAAFPAAPVMEKLTVPEEQARAYFDKNASAFVSPETIVVESAVFALPEAAKSLGGKERVTALQDVAGRAAEFAGSVSGSDFARSAEAAGAVVSKSQAYDRRSSAASGLPPDVARSAFLLTGDGAVGDVTQAEDEFYVLRVVERNPERPMTFEEARSVVEERIKQIEVERILRDKVAAAVAVVRKSVADGGSLAEGFAKAEVTPQQFTAVDPSDQEAAPEVAMAARVSTLLTPGQVSNPFPDMGGLSVVAVTARAEAKPEPDAAEKLVDGQQSLFFASWLEAARQAANVTTPNRNRAP